jgi:hypothetical protein
MRNCFEVSCVGKIVKAISDDRQFTVNNLDRRYLNIADAEWGIGLNRMRDELWQAATHMGRIKDVAKYPPKVGPRDLIRINTHRSVSKIKRPNIIQPKDVINVTVSNQNGVKIFDLCAKSLLAKIDRGINKDLFVLVLDQDRDAKAFVTGIV